MAVIRLDETQQQELSVVSQCPSRLFRSQIAAPRPQFCWVLNLVTLLSGESPQWKMITLAQLRRRPLRSTIAF